MLSAFFLPRQVAKLVGTTSLAPPAKAGVFVCYKQLKSATTSSGIFDLTIQVRIVK
jgi:hypothetical protein